MDQILTGTNVKRFFGKTLPFDGVGIGWPFWLVNEYFASMLHRKPGAGDVIGEGIWIGGPLF